MKVITPIIFITILATGCASFQPPWKTIYNSQTETKVKKSYSLNTEYKVTTGSPMLSAKTYKENIWYEPISNEAVIWNGNTLTNNVDGKVHIFTPKYQFLEEGDFILTSPTFYQNAIGIIAFEDGTVPANPVMRIDRKGSLERYPITPQNHSKQIFKKRHFRESDTSKQFMFELIYTGKSDQTVNLLYREYINDMSRDSFRQSLTYNLEESKEISFKSLKINIINASNSEISFTIKDDKDLEWLK